MRRNTCLLSLLLAACSGSTSPIGDGGSRDAPPSTGDGSAGCAGKSCAAGTVCYQGSCVPDLGPCQTDDDCQGDSFCQSGRCLPYGPTTKTHDPGCKHDGFTPESLRKPSVKCDWTKHMVWSTPMVIDLNGDKKPEILFIALTGTAGVGGATALVALDGASCKEVFVKDAGLHYCSHLAVGDLDGDKKPEIVGIDGSYKVHVLDASGKELAVATEAAKTGKGKNPCTGASLVNLDGQGPAEIVYGGMALRFEAGKLTTLYNVDAPDNAWGGLIVVAADVNLDGKPELITGNRIFDGLTGADLTPAAVKAFGQGFAAVAQFDPATKEPEIVLVSSPDPNTGSKSLVRIYHPKTGALFFGPVEIGPYWGGPPTVADFDGDGKPEVAVAGETGYLLLDPKCEANPLPSFCQSKGIRWLKPTQDKSSGFTGSSVFDFNGDGKAEVVYRDECWLRIYEGATGKVLFAFPRTSGTGSEMAIVADTDGDGHADIVVPSTSDGLPCGEETELKLPHPGMTQGVQVLQDPDNRWMPSRPIWNQHAYHITNINDDGTVPQKELPSWESWNNYRQNVQGLQKTEIPGLDLTAHRSTEIDPLTDCANLWVLIAEVCNRGLGTVPSGVKGSFYLGDPRKGGTLICTAKTSQALAPGECTKLRCDWKGPQKGNVDLWFLADDDGTGAGVQPECKEKNNALQVKDVVCPGAID